MAMDAYRKAADGGVCLAMVNIGELYRNGNGVPPSAALAREWSAKAESCHAKRLDRRWDKTATLRAMADGGRLPAAGERPTTRPTALATDLAGGLRVTTDQKFLAGVGALLAAATALDALYQPSGDSGASSAGAPDIDLARRWRQDDMDRQNMGNLLAPMPKLR
jgi:TPR repeat protein